METDMRIAGLFVDGMLTPTSLFSPISRESEPAARTKRPVEKRVLLVDYCGNIFGQRKSRGRSLNSSRMSLYEAMQVSDCWVQLFSVGGGRFSVQTSQGQYMTVSEPIEEVAWVKASSGRI